MTPLYHGLGHVVGVEAVRVVDVAGGGGERPQIQGVVADETVEVSTKDFP